ncbi:transporter [Bifidobacterium sp. DSM 109958]|uniref:Transporter n=1 Tax=Bifidobacterium moraviense TaxID=2675323 RepID=A0A7Y0F1K7_9BIFI|nr:hypothetical protein [Bifidobacterium sp. DSM 109958]NMN00344.1 transporter [Bifidobacterium sp. DSM 109958]
MDETTADKMTAAGVQPTVRDLTGVQAAAYVLLLACAALPVALGLTPDETFSPGVLIPVACALALVLAFHAMWPFRGIPGLGWFSRLFSALIGVVSVAAGWHVLVVGDRYVTYRSASVLWGCLFGILMTVLVIVGFGRQMLRRDRSHLIVTLSRCIISGVCSAAAGGWCFLPMLLLEAGRAELRGLGWQYALVALAVLVLVLCIGAIGVLWRGDAELVAPRSWIGLALMPVMLSGMPVYLGALGLMFPLNW